MSFQVFTLLDGSSANVETIESTTDPTPQVDFSGGVARIVLHLRSYHATLNRADVRRINTADQWIDYPDDAFYEFTPAMIDATLTFIPRSRIR